MEKIRKYIGKIGKGIATTALAGYLALGSIGQARTETSFSTYFDAVERKEEIEEKIIDLCTDREFLKLDREFLKLDIAISGDYYGTLDSLTGTLDSLTKVLEGYDAKIDSVGKILVESDKGVYKLGREAQKLGTFTSKIKRKYFPVEDFCEKYYPTE